MAVAIVLAAGSATRFGATKQLVEVDGRPLVAHAVTVADRAGLARTLVVVGHDAEAVAAAARAAGPVEVVVNEDHRWGQAGSLRTGIEQALTGGEEIAVVLLADQPGVTPASIRTVVAEVAAGAPAARLRYDDGPSHPVAFAREVWDRLLAVTGDRGARDLLADLDIVEVPAAGPAPPDIDTPGDLGAGG